MDPEEEARLAAEAAARATPPAGATPTVDYSRRVVVNGEAREFDTTEEAQAFLAGVPERLRPFIVPDTAEAHAARRLRREYGNNPGDIASAAGAVRGATVGLSDAAVGLVSDDAAEYLAGIREANPEASLAGEIGGAVAPVLLSGGLGAAPLAGRGLLRGAIGLVGAPTRAVAGLAEGLGGVVGRGLLGAGTGAGRRIAASALGVGVEGAVEGAFAEAGTMLSERSLGTGDPELTAEMVLARLGTGAMYGGAVGGVLGGAGRSVERGVSGLRDASASVLSRGWRSAIGTDMNPTLARAWSTAAARGEVGAEAIGRALGPEGPRYRRLIERGDEVYEMGARSIGRDQSAMEEAAGRALRYWREGLRVGEMERLVDPARLLDQATTARSLAADLRDRVEALATDFHGTPVGGVARGLGRSLDVRINELVEGARLGSGARASAEINAALNGMKREVDNLVARSRGMGPVADALRDANDTIRRSLEDGALWGERAATAHREVNAGFTRFLTTREQYARRFLVEGASDASRPDWNPYDRMPEADSARVVGFLRGVGTASNDTVATTFRQHTEAMAALLDTMQRHLTLDPAARAAVDQARVAYRTLVANFDSLSNDVGFLNQWRHLDQNQNIGRAIIAGTLGTAMGGPIAGLAATALTNPAGVIRGLGMLERWTAGTAENVSEGLRDFVRGGREAGRRAARNVRTAAVAGTVRAYMARIDRLEQESRRPAERIAAATTGLDIAPRTREALTRTAVRANAYLTSVRPPSGVLPGEVRPTRRVPNRSAIARFMRRARAVDDPMSVINDLSTGDVSPDSVEALRAVYPRLYQQIRLEALRYVAEDGQDMAHNRLVALGVLLGIPTVPSLVPSMVAVMQQGYAVAAPQSPAGSSRPMRLAEGMASGVESLERRRA